MPANSNTQNSEPLMTAEYVVWFYNQLIDLEIETWVDGGWAVDALLGKQLRPHNDLDIAMQWKDVPRLREFLAGQGYEQVREDSQWNFVLADDKGHEIDVHAFVYDQSGEIVDGIMYPTKALSETGTIAGQEVNCILAKYMVEFLAPWIHQHPHKYLEAVSELCKAYNFDLPQEYHDFVKGS
jgi:lincosamide nucleotidyltransferase A/C/D/E